MMLRRDIPKAAAASLWRRLAWPKATLSTAVDYLGVPGLRRPKDFPQLATRAVADARDTLGAWKKDDSPHKVVNMIDGVSNSLCRIADAAELTRNVHSDDHWVNEASEAVNIVAQYMSEANVDSTLYDKCVPAAERASAEDSGCSKEEQDVIKAMREAMENEGVHLDDDRKKELIALQEEDAIKSFEIVSQQDNDDPSDDGQWLNVPQQWMSILRLLPKRTVHKDVTEVFLPKDHAAIGYLLKACEDPTVRQKVWKLNHRGEPKKEAALRDLVSIRQKLAKIRGYNTWNEYVMRESVLSGSAAVKDFLSELWLALLPGLGRELNVLESTKRLHTNDPNATLQPWDIDFYVSLWKQMNQPPSLQELGAILSINALIEGSQRVSSTVLGVDMKEHNIKGEAWSDDVRRFEFNDATTSDPYGVLYLDPCERAWKKVQSAQFTIAGSCVLPDGSRQLPRTAMVLSLSELPGALGQGAATTYMHEFGHAAHSILSRTTLQHFSGSRGCIDFVEFPSHLFEYFVLDPNALSSLVLPNLSARAVEDYSNFRMAFGHIEAAQQLIYALVDQVFYAYGNVADDLAQFLPVSQDAMMSNHRLIELLSPPGQAQFSHLVHYGGNYYCYLLCKAVAADVWSRGGFADKDPMAGQRLRHFLEAGSVTQTMDKIYELVPSGRSESSSSAAGHVPLDAMLRLLNTCTSIHDSVAQQEKASRTQIHEGRPGKEGGEIHFCENTNDTTDICNAQWMMLYTAAAYAPDRLSSSQQKVYTDFFDGFIDRCEHPIVGGMIEDEIQRSRPRVASNKEMLIWLCTIENKCRYSEYATALAYRPDGARRPPVYEYPGQSPPQEVGWDPLGKLDTSSFRGQQARVYLAAKNMTYSGDDDTLYEEDLAYLSQPEAEMIGTCRDVCGLLLSAIKNQFGSFKDLCADYYAISEEATDSFGRTTFWFINSLSFETRPQQ
ncbi:hypothetical protein FOZ60_009801 [Perkinsus olseni]|uniref:Peptidase M3A/M3B catalytic domain-containing protein n=1 Tax=Perkinsus olseni TaxID=32597 RepID=A0A7J6NHI8_PEROL|nr:hypothetical protein FOZ60_009801 [Perkinsus olseni]